MRVIGTILVILIGISINAYLASLMKKAGIAKGYAYLGNMLLVRNYGVYICNCPARQDSAEPEPKDY